MYFDVTLLCWLWRSSRILSIVVAVCMISGASFPKIKEKTDRVLTRYFLRVNWEDIHTYQVLKILPVVIQEPRRAKMRRYTQESVFETVRHSHPHVLCTHSNNHLQRKIIHSTNHIICYNNTDRCQTDIHVTDSCSGKYSWFVYMQHGQAAEHSSTTAAAVVVRSTYYCCCK